MWYYYRVKDYSECRLSFDGTVVSDVSCVRNLGVFFDKTLSMEKQVSATSKSCFYQIRNIERIRTYISDDASRSYLDSVLMWHCHVILLYDTTIWHYNMTLPYDTTIWHYHMTLLYDTTIWHYHMKEPFETTMYSAVTIKVKWNISWTEIPLGCIAYHFEEKDILHRFRHVVAF
jgi:hypothetical protein